MKIKQIKTIFKLKKNSSQSRLYVSHPPRNSITNKADISRILLYSPKKNIANMIEEYSTLYPATSSASASGKSNGDLFVSAKIEIKKIIANGKSGNTNQML
jgi:hypothetical protein